MNTSVFGFGALAPLYTLEVCCTPDSSHAVTAHGSWTDAPGPNVPISCVAVLMHVLAGRRMPDKTTCFWCSPTSCIRKYRNVFNGTLFSSLPIGGKSFS